MKSRSNVKCASLSLIPYPYEHMFLGKDFIGGEKKLVMYNTADRKRLSSQEALSAPSTPDTSPQAQSGA